MEYIVDMAKGGIVGGIIWGIVGGIIGVSLLLLATWLIDRVLEIREALKEVAVELGL